MQDSHSREAMKSLTIVGGVYREICRLPVLSDDVWGSGGRAAAVTAGLGIPTTLHTASDEKTARAVASLGESFGFAYEVTKIPASFEFHYVHALAPPNIWPPTSSPMNTRISVTSEAALVFGMLEASADVRASKIVFDPQSPFSPVPLKVSEQTRELAYVLNWNEAQHLSGHSIIRDAGTTILERFHVEVVVIKRGPWGAMIFEKSGISEVSAYETGSVWPIGSGDVFAATFAAYWAAKDRSAAEAAELASRAAATYVDTRVLPIPPQAIERDFGYRALALRDVALAAGEYHVYLAGPFFNIAQLWLVEEARIALSAMQLRVFSPYHEIGMGPAHDVAPLDLEALRNCRIIFALVDGLDPGTVFEVGFARAIDKSVVALASSTPEEAMKMISGTKCEILSDFATAIYRASWAAKR